MNTNLDNKNSEIIESSTDLEQQLKRDFESNYSEFSNSNSELTLDTIDVSTDLYALQSNLIPKIGEEIEDQMIRPNKKSSNYLLRSDSQEFGVVNEAEESYEEGKIKQIDYYKTMNPSNTNSGITEEEGGNTQ